MSVVTTFHGTGIQNSGYGDFNARDIHIGAGPDHLLADLRVTDPRDDKVRIQATKGGLLKDSYRWILDHDDFLQWRNDPHGRLLWIKGDPGKGKTMLLCGIIDHLTRTAAEARRLAYFFCQATDERLNNATAVLRGLLYMLVGQYPRLVSHIREEYGRAGKRLFEDSNAWFAMSRILMAMLDDEILDGVVLIVDALDECSADRQRLLDFIARGSASSRVRWIISSRNWPDIEEKLDNTSQKVTLRLELNDDSIADAVRAYIRHEVRELAQLKKYDEETRYAIHRHVTNKAGNTFLWVALVCQELANPDVQSWEALDILRTFPSGLESLYERMMEHLFKSRHAGLCRRILAVASIVYRPVSLKELASIDESLARFTDNPIALETLVGSCGSFLTLLEGIVYFVHQSAKDFLLDKASVLPNGIAHQHRAIFSTSIEVLSRTLRRDIYNLVTPGFSIRDIIPPDPDPLAPARYSCIYWVDHLQDANSMEKLTEEYLRDNGPVHTFLQRKYLYWLEALSLFGGLSQAVLAIQKLAALATRVGMQQLAHLVRDALRFILSHRGAIEIAPLQLYASALVFSPTRSLVKNLFEHEKPSWIISPPAMGLDWNACVQTLDDGDQV
ncbi:Vegetative incompatibility protein HET-E-1, partial [Tolypocladium ophioglossoides CBS 100239]